MSGHSKWSQIKRMKAANDAKRGQAFSKLAREITVAARAGGPDPDSNYRLRLAIQKAKAANMPNEPIERAVKRGTGELGDAPEMLELTYEGYGPGGAALYIQVLSDNRNRTVAQIRNVLDNAGGHLAASGSVAWLFQPRGEVVVKTAGFDADRVFMLAVDAGAEDVEFVDNQAYVWTRPESLDAVRQELVKAQMEVEQAELGRVAQTPLNLDGQTAVKVLRLIEKLEELDDVRTVDTNLSISLELVESFAAA